MKTIGCDSGGITSPLSATSAEQIGSYGAVR
jgi:hypothetical protein